MSVVNSDSVTDIVKFLELFNKEISEMADYDNSVVPYAPTTTTHSNVPADSTAYTLNKQMLHNNIVIMVMDNQQYLLMPNTALEASTCEETRDLVPSNNETAITEATTTNVRNIPKQTVKKIDTSSQGQPIKQKLNVKEISNDISVSDFTYLNNMSNPNTTLVDVPDATLLEMASDGHKNNLAIKRPKKISKKSKSFEAPETSSIMGANKSPQILHNCTQCSYSTSKRYLLSRHLKSHSDVRPYQCTHCDRAFKTISSLHNHINTHTGTRPHPCAFCNNAFTTSGELVRHIRYRHTHEKPHRCTECDYAAVELSKLKRHMRCHTGERPYSCPNCEYTSLDNYKMKRHLRVHTGDTPYICNICQHRFTQSNSLKAHLITHSGNRPTFMCDLCPTTCSRKADLRTHVVKMHTTDKMLDCPRCKESFPDRYTYKEHQQTHVGEKLPKTFKCTLCSSAYVTSPRLQAHILTHTNQQPDSTFSGNFQLSNEIKLEDTSSESIISNESGIIADTSFDKSTLNQQQQFINFEANQAIASFVGIYPNADAQSAFMDVSTPGGQLY